MDLLSMVFTHVFDELLLRVKGLVTCATRGAVMHVPHVLEQVRFLYRLMAAVIAAKGTLVVVVHHVAYHVVHLVIRLTAFRTPE